MTHDQHSPSDTPSAGEPRSDTEPTAGPDPLSRWLGLVAGLLVIVVLASVLGFALYLRTIDAPRTVVERDIERYKTAVLEEPSKQENHLRLAFAYAQADRYALAQQTIERAYELGETPDLFYAEAEVFRVSGRYDQAIQSYDMAVQEATTAYEATLRTLEQKAIITAPPNSLLASALLGRGTTYRALGDSSAAIADFEAAREIAPTDATLLAALGDAYAEAGERDAAAAAYREALRFVADLPAAVDGLRALGEAP